jgi:hypothetical protein
VYDEHIKALDCEAKKRPLYKYKVGEEVVIHVRYPEDKNRIFAKRTVKTLLCNNKHEPVYELNELVQTGKALYEGSSTFYKDSDGIWVQPADEDTLFQIGQIKKFWSETIEKFIERPITENDINPEE